MTAERVAVLIILVLLILVLLKFLGVI